MYISYDINDIMLTDPNTPRICRKMGIDFAEVMIGWDLIKGRNVPQ